MDSTAEPSTAREPTNQVERAVVTGLADIPTEILVEILSFLPMSSILTVRSTARLWRWLAHRHYASKASVDYLTLPPVMHPLELAFPSTVYAVSFDPQDESVMYVITGSEDEEPSGEEVTGLMFKHRGVPFNVSPCGIVGATPPTTPQLIPLTAGDTTSSAALGPHPLPPSVAHLPTSFHSNLVSFTSEATARQVEDLPANVNPASCTMYGRIATFQKADLSGWIHFNCGTNAMVIDQPDSVSHCAWSASSRTFAYATDNNVVTVIQFPNCPEGRRADGGPNPTVAQAVAAAKGAVTRRHQLDTAVDEVFVSDETLVVLLASRNPYTELVAFHLPPLAGADPHGGQPALPNLNLGLSLESSLSRPPRSPEPQCHHHHGSGMWTPPTTSRADPGPGKHDLLVKHRVRLDRIHVCATIHRNTLFLIDTTVKHAMIAWDTNSGVTTYTPLPFIAGVVAAPARRTKPYIRWRQMQACCNGNVLVATAQKTDARVLDSPTSPRSASAFPTAATGSATAGCHVVVLPADGSLLRSVRLAGPAVIAAHPTSAMVVTAPVRVASAYSHPLVEALESGMGTIVSFEPSLDQSARRKGGRKRAGSGTGKHGGPGADEEDEGVCIWSVVTVLSFAAMTIAFMWTITALLFGWWRNLQQPLVDAAAALAASER